MHHLLEHVQIPDSVDLRAIAQHEPVAKHGNDHGAHVLHVRGGLSTKRRTRFRSEDEGLRSARPGAEADQFAYFLGRFRIVGAGRATEGHGELHGSRGDRHSWNEALQRAHFVGVEHPRDAVGLNARCPPRDFALFLFRGVVDVKLEQEPIELGLGKQVRPLLLDRISRREDEKRVRQRMRLRAHGDAALLHRLQKGRLRLRRRSIDFVRQDQMMKDRSTKKPYDAPMRSLQVDLVAQDVGAGDVRGKKVWRKLNPPEG